MRLRHLIAAGAVSVDRNTGRMSLFEIVEEFRVKNFPAVIPRISIVAGIAFEDGEIGQTFKVIFQISRPPGKTHETFPFDLTAASRLQHIIPQFNAMPLAEEGSMVVTAYDGDKSLGELTIAVTAANESDPPDPLLLIGRISIQARAGVTGATVDISG